MAGTIVLPTVGTVSGLAQSQNANTALAALSNMFQSGTAPTPGSTGLGSTAGIWWHDTTNKLIRVRSQDDTTWITIATLDETLYTANATLALGAGLALSGASTLVDPAYLRGFLSGLGVSRASTTTMTFAVGACANEAAQIDAGTKFLMRASTAMTKTLQAAGAWAAGTGNNGLFTGARANSTWYHCFAIRKTSDGSIDFGFDTSISAANIPAGYVGYRRLRSILTDGSGNIILDMQNGDWIWWDSPTLDYNTALTGGAARTLIDCSAAGVSRFPPGLKTHQLINMGDAPVGDSLVLTSPDLSDAGTVIGGHSFGDQRGSASNVHQAQVTTNTSQQIGIRIGTNGSPTLFCRAYMDLRGRYA